MPLTIAIYSLKDEYCSEVLGRGLQ